MNSDFERVLSRLMDGAADEGDLRELRELLRGNYALQDEYCRAMELHALLDASLSEPPARLRAFPRVAEAGVFRALSPRGGRGWFIAAAAGLFVAALGLGAIEFLGRSPGRQSQVAQDGPPAERGGCVAVLGQASRAVWEGEGPTTIGAPLAPGEYSLREGVVQIDFLRGANVIVQGPARFELTSTDLIRCDAGGIRAHVPEHAKGFTVATPIYSAVDLGTEFAVIVDRSGGALFQVLDGEVELRDLSRPRSSLVRLVRTGQGMRSTPNGELSIVAGADPGIMGRGELEELAAKEHRKQYERWVAFRDETRARSDVIAYYPFESTTNWDRRLRGYGVGRESALDGAIVGCQWAEGRWPAKQSLDFKRPTDRVRVRVEGEYESVTLAAWFRVEGFNGWLSSLLLPDGHDLGEVHWQLTDMGQLMLGVKTAVNRSDDFYSPSVLSREDMGRWVHLVSVYDGPLGEVRHFVDGRRVSTEPVRSQTRLRFGASEIGNWSPKELSDYRNRVLNGRVDEVLLLSVPLVEAEVRDIYLKGHPHGAGPAKQRGLDFET